MLVDVFAQCNSQLVLVRIFLDAMNAQHLLCETSLPTAQLFAHSAIFYANYCLSKR